MIHDWINIKEENELDILINTIPKEEKKRGFDLVRKLIKDDVQEFQRKNTKEDISLVFNMGSRSRKGLLEKIKILREFLKQTNQEVIQKEAVVEVIDKGIDSGENISENKYFKDDIHELAYYLVELEGEERLEKLEVYEAHFYDKDMAKKWYRTLVKKIHPDKLKKENKKIANMAMEQLTAMYKRMTKNAK